MLLAIAPALGRAGLGHVAPPIATALAHDVDPALVLVGPRRPQ